MSKADITDGMSIWEYSLYNEREQKKERINKLIQKYGFPVRERNLLEEDYIEYDLLKDDLEKMENQDSVYRTLARKTSLDDEDMAENAEVGEKKQNREDIDDDAEALRKIRENSQKQKSHLSLREKREEEIMDEVDEEIDNWSDDDWKEYLKTQSSLEQNAYKILHILPEYRILAKNKAKMEKAGKMIVKEFGSGAADGLDNLYHRRGMYEIGQRIHKGNLLSSDIGLLLGGVKELHDIYKKYKQGKPLPEVLLDSLKDMSNNNQGLNDGKYHFKSSREYYKDFDYKRNRKKKK